MYIIIRSFFYPTNRQIRTKIWRLFICLLLLGFFSVIGWGSFFAPQLIRVTPVKVDLGQTLINENIKIAFFSDIHVGAFKKSGFVKRTVKKILELKPDLVLLGGDFIDKRENQALFLEPLKNLASQIPILTIVGNHEYHVGKLNDPDQEDRSQTLRQLFQEWNIPILDNANQIFQINGQTLAVCGVIDIWTGRADLQAAQKGLAPSIPKILLAHNPDIILQPAAEDFPLILSGHTHAGQIRLPGLGPLCPIPTELGRKFDYGLFSLNQGYLYITNGLGDSGVRARLFNRPEIALIYLDL